MSEQAVGDELFERLDAIRTLIHKGNTVKAASELDWFVLELKLQKDQIRLDNSKKVD